MPEVTELHAALDHRHLFSDSIMEQREKPC